LHRLSTSWLRQRGNAQQQVRDLAAGATLDRQRAAALILLCHLLDHLLGPSELRGGRAVVLNSRSRRHAVLGNIGTIISFRIGEVNAPYLARAIYFRRKRKSESNLFEVLKFPFRGLCPQ
jgi:hypothetical protein